MRRHTENIDRRNLVSLLKPFVFVQHAFIPSISVKESELDKRTKKTVISTAYPGAVVSIELLHPEREKELYAQLHSWLNKEGTDLNKRFHAQHHLSAERFIYREIDRLRNYYHVR